MLKMHLYTLLVGSLILICTVESAGVVQYNSSVSCLSSAPCDLADPNIWMYGVLPSENDTVQIYPPQDGKIYSFYTTAKTTQLQDLLVRDIVLNISASIQINNLTVINSTVAVSPGATLVLAVGAYFIGSSNVSVLARGTIESYSNMLPDLQVYFDASSSFDIKGTFLLWSGDMEIYGSITTSASADLTYYGNLTYAPRNSSINSVPLLYSVYIPDNHEYVFPEGAQFGSLHIGSNSTITLMNIASVSSTMYSGPSLFIKAGGVLNLINVYNSKDSLDFISLPSGEGRINVHSSRLYFFGGALYSDEPATSLSFSGPDNIAIFSYSILQNISFSVDANIHIQAYDLMLINDQAKPLYIPGDIEVYRGSLLFNGSFTFAGGLESDAAYIESIGHDITFGGDVTMFGEAPFYDTKTYPSVWNLSRGLTTPKLTLYNSSLISVVGNLQITGDVINEAGNFQLNENQLVLINGEYFQGSAANLLLMGLDTSLNSSHYLSARLTSLSASIGGQVLYSFSNISENSRWPILRTVTGKIKGTFAPKAIALFQNATHELGFDYSSPDVVYMVYHFSASKVLAWYYWLAISCGILIVMLAIGFAVVKLTQKKEYALVTKETEMSTQAQGLTLEVTTK